MAQGIQTGAIKIQVEGLSTVSSDGSREIEHACCRLMDLGVCWSLLARRVVSLAGSTEQLQGQLGARVPTQGGHTDGEHQLEHGVHSLGSTRVGCDVTRER